MRTPRILVLTLASLTIAAAALADGLIVIDRPPVQPANWPHHAFTPLEVRTHHVVVTIDEQVATTTVDQTFFNPSSERLEGTYLFPIPRGGTVDSFSMDIDGRMVQAELLDADKARGIYEDIVRRMKDPALLEYAGQGLFKVRIFPIEPRAEKKVRMRYSQVLTNEGGLVEYVYPLNTEKFSAQPIDSVSVKVELSVASGIRSLYCPSHDADIARHGRNQAVVGWEGKRVRPDTDFQLFYSPEAAVDVGLSLLTYREGTDDGYFLLLATPSTQLVGEKVADKDVVFVLDTSGSMAEGGKLDQAKKALQFCLTNLNRGDRFEVVRFSTEAEPLLGSLVEASEANRARAVELVKQLKPIGGTAIEEALGKALEPAAERTDKGRPYVVVFLTDGRPTIGATDDEVLVTGATRAIGEATVRVFCFGIGTDVNTHLLDRLAESTRAVSQYVLPSEDLEVKVSNFYLKINDPVLANPELAVLRPVRVSKVHPGRLPDLFRGEQLMVLGRYSGSGDAAITVKGTVNGRERTFTYEAKFPARSDEHPFVPKLWATRRVGYLLDQIRLHGESQELRDEVTDLARRYGIVTPYTAYLIVEDEDRRALPVTSRTLQGFDGAVEQEAERMYREVGAAKSGDAAVGGAQALDALKRAESPAAPMAANVMAQRGQVGSAAGSSEQVVRAMQAQQSRYVAGQTFYQSGQQWVDARVQARPDQTRVKVRVGSEEFFALARTSQAAAQWLSLGPSVVVLIGDQVYEITE